MADWDQLRKVGHEVSPPSFESLARTAAKRDRRARVVAVSATLAVATALGFGIALVDDDADDTIQPAETPSSSISTPTDAALPDGVVALPGPDEGEEYATLAPARYRVRLDDTLAFDVDIPEGTFAYDDGLFLSTGPIVLKTEVANERYGVSPDPCAGVSPAPVGPSIDDLVEAIRDEPIYETTTPEPVELGGAEGTYLEVRIPPDFDASPCEGGAVLTPGYLDTGISWEPGYRGRYWILDVDGQRVVIMHHCGSCSAEQLDRLATIPDSITFAPTA